MWVFSKTGFVSVTDNPEQPDTYLVRARTRDDLTMFACYSDVTWGFDPDASITDSGDERDYRWRLVMPKHMVKAIIADQLDDLDYTNVKDTIDKGDPARRDALLGVWSSMMQMQDGGLYNPGGEAYEADLDYREAFYDRSR